MTKLQSIGVLILFATQLTPTDALRAQSEKTIKMLNNSVLYMPENDPSQVELMKQNKVKVQKIYFQETSSEPADLAEENHFNTEGQLVKRLSYADNAVQSTQLFKYSGSNLSEASMITPAEGIIDTVILRLRYNEIRQLKEISSNTGVSRTFDYDSQGILKRCIQLDGSMDSIKIFGDTLIRAYQLTVPEHIDYFFDNQQRIIKQIVYYTGEVVEQKKMIYDDKNRLTEHWYKAMDYPITRINYHYNNKGLVTEEQASDGTLSTYKYEFF